MLCVNNTTIGYKTPTIPRHQGVYNIYTDRKGCDNNDNKNDNGNEKDNKKLICNKFV